MCGILGYLGTHIPDTEAMYPDLTLVFDMDPEAALARVHTRNSEGSARESRLDDEPAEFHRRVREGFLELAEREPDRVRVIDAVREVLAYAGHDPEIRFLEQMPTGPLNRVADNSLARQLLGWEPQVRFVDGLHRTMDWYFATKDRDEVERHLEEALTER